jgi:hypothetical protein
MRPSGALVSVSARHAASRRITSTLRAGVVPVRAAWTRADVGYIGLGERRQRREELQRGHDAMGGRTGKPVPDGTAAGRDADIRVQRETRREKDDASARLVRRDDGALSRRWICRMNLAPGSRGRRAASQDGELEVHFGKGPERDASDNR